MFSVVFSQNGSSNYVWLIEMCFIGFCLLVPEELLRFFKLVLALLQLGACRVIESQDIILVSHS